MRELIKCRIPYIGFIPNTWNINRGKNIFNYIQKPVLEGDQVITCFRDGQVTLRSNRREDGFTISEKEIGYQGIDVGDLIVHGMDGFAGAIGISDSRGKASPVLNVLDTKMDKRFYMYYLRNMADKGVFISLSTGIRVRTCDTNWGKLRDIYYAVPPLEEQLLISSFLDKKCSEIDDILNDIERQINDLEHLKRSIIFKAVTQGLNPSDKTKDSGISWIGPIPSHWNRMKVRDGFVRKKTKAYQEDPVVLSLARSGVKIRDISTNEGQLAASYFEYNPVTIDDLLLNPMDLQSGANCSISKVEGVISPAYVNLRYKNGFDPNYFDYYFKTQYWSFALFTYGKGVSFDNRWSINEDTLMHFPLIVPPLQEQIERVSYLNKECKRIDEIMEDKQKMIDNLCSLKKTIISDFVTGKKEVPNE